MKFKLSRKIKQAPFLYMIFGAILIAILLHLDSIWSIVAEFLNVIKPFFISICIAYILNPIIHKLQSLFDKVHKFKFNRLLSVLITYSITITLIVFCCIYVTPEISGSIKDIANKIPDYISEIKPLLEKLNIDTTSLNAEYLQNYLLNFVKSEDALTSKIFSTAASIVGTIINIIISIVFSIYILIDKDKIFRYLRHAGDALFGEDKTNYIADNINECSTSINKFLVGKIIDSVIVGILCFIALTIMQYPYAILISVIVGVTNIVPDIGAIIGAIPGILIYLSIDIKTAAIFAIMIFCLQQLDGNVIGAKIIGTKLGIRPMAVLPSVIISGHYFGIMGMILGVPLMSTLNLYLCRYFDSKIQARKQADKKSADLRKECEEKLDTEQKT